MFILPPQAELVIVGAGAAGLTTAIFAATKNPKRKILLLEGEKKAGAKILISGGGRCNVTNAVVKTDDFFGGNSRIVKKVLSAFSAEKTVQFFHEIGVSLHEEPGGKLFPDSNRAKNVLDALLQEAEKRGAQLITDCRVQSIRKIEKGFELTTTLGVLETEKLVLATGGLSIPKTGSDGAGLAFAQALGHSLVPTTPALAPLLLDGSFHTNLSGISQDVEVLVQIEGEKLRRFQAAMLWTHFGVSGPVMLNVSRFWHRAKLENLPVRISINFFPDHDFEKLEKKFLDWVQSKPKSQLGSLLSEEGVPSRLGEALLSSQGISKTTPVSQLPREARRQFIRSIIDWPLEIRDSRGYGYAEATAGGIPLEEIDSASMESKKCPGLYLVGEILDVDGRIGGFNFQWAWSSGWVAGNFS